MKAFTIVFIITSSILMFMYYANLFTYKQVYLIEDGVKTSYTTNAKTVGEFLCLEKVLVRNIDKISVSKNSGIETGMEIKIERAFPVKLCYNNEVRKVFATAVPVSAVLSDSSITLSKEDYINVESGKTVEPNMLIDVKDYTTEFVEDKIAIPYSEQVTYSDDLDSSVQKVIKEGVNGEKILKYKVTYMGGKEVSREKISEEIVKQPQNKVIQKGTANLYRAPNGNAYKYKKMISATATAYTLSELRGSSGHTCLGLNVRRGIVAVDPRVIPLRSRLYIEGYGEAIAGDTGGAIKGNKIDVYVDTLAEANRYGVRRGVKVYVLK